MKILITLDDSVSMDEARDMADFLESEYPCVMETEVFDSCCGKCDK